MDKATIIRIALLALALTNQILVSTGNSILPFDEAMIEQLLSAGFTVVMAGIATYKNTNVSKEAKIADAKMKQMKADNNIAKLGGGAPQENNDI